MSDGKQTANPLPGGTNTATPSLVRPFQPDIEGELRSRLFKYARDKGRSASNAVRWLLSEGLRKEGY